MANLVYDDGPLWESKTDLRPLGAGEDSTGFGRAADWNTARQWVSDLKDVVRAREFNVLHYGATGNDTANDTAAVQAAIDAALASGRGEVFLPPGTYSCGTLTLPSKVHLRGAGPHVTILKLRAGTNADLVRGADFATLTGTSDTGGIYGFSVSNLTLDGNKANNTAGAGLRFFGYQFRIGNVVIRNCKDYGLWAEWQPSGANPAAADADFVESFLQTVKVHSCDNEGIVWAGPHDSGWHDVVAYNNGRGAGTGAPTGFGDANIRVASAGNSLLAVSCHAWGNKADWAWRLEGRAHLTNCTGEGGRTGQLLVLASDSRVDGGEYFADALYRTVKGIVLGQSGTTVARTALNFPSVRDCESGAYDTTYSNGQDIIALHVDQSAGTVRIGTPAVDSVYLVRAKSTADAMTRLPGDVAVRGSAFTVTDAAFDPIFSATPSGITASKSLLEHLTAVNGKFFRGTTTSSAVRRLLGLSTDDNVYVGDIDGASGVRLRSGGNDYVRVDTGTLALTLGVATGRHGFYGATPTGKPAVTGSRGGNAALASLLTGLAALGLITDSTTP